MTYNYERTAKMQRKSVAELQAFYQAATLSSAAAAYELRKRGVVPKRTIDTSKMANFRKIE